MIQKRAYTLKRRAESQADTRRRIVEATVNLHSEIGPAQTSISAVAERAGVQRHTVYAHFPTERELHMACSGLALERDPLPDEAAWRTIAEPERRLRRGLAELYGWFSRNAELAACVMRDAEFHPLTRDIVDIRMGPRLNAYRKVFAEGVRPTPQVRAFIDLALSFHTWQSLTKDGGLSVDAAVDVMVRMLSCLAR
jgi:AcrR family transcriptional regulator